MYCPVRKDRTVQTLCELRKALRTVTLAAFLLFFSLNSIFSQTIDKQHYAWFDARIGLQNTGLSNGTRFLDSYKIYKGQHQYYRDSKFLVGDLVYSGQPYFDIDMKYDLFRDELVAAIPFRSNLSIIQLVKKEISSFSIEGRTFIRIDGKEAQGPADQNQTGFFELLHDDSSYKILKKHRKTDRTVIDDKVLYHRFKEAYFYFLYRDGQFFPLQKKSDWIELYPESRKDINTFYRTNRKMLKTDQDKFVTWLSLRVYQTSNPKPLP